VRQALVLGNPEIARLVPCYEIHLFAGHAFYGNKPPVLEISQSALCGYPDSPAII
jgi:hypothetical protein